MPPRAARRVVLAAACATLAAACGPKRIASPAGPPRPGEVTVVLLTDRPAGTVGRARVSNQSGTADLSAARAAITVVAGEPPAAIGTISEEDVERRFGGAIAALPAPPRAFTLNFRFESDELTDESRELLPEILKTVKERPAPDVLVIGHTDSAGAARANFELGLKRATMVRGILIEAGLESALVKTVSLGERDLLVKTPDGTPEPRNRRVEIAVR